MGTTISRGQISSYTAALADLSEKRVEFGFEQAAKLWRPEFGKTFPVPAEIREYAMQYQPVDPIAATREYLKRDDKPIDWSAIGSRGGITAADIAEWLEAGKKEQRAVIANLEADPEWRATARRLGGFPGLPGKALVKSEVPVDAGERSTWARFTAQDAGWIERAGRQPGEEG